MSRIKNVGFQKQNIAESRFVGIWFMFAVCIHKGIFSLLTFKCLLIYAPNIADIAPLNLHQWHTSSLGRPAI